MTNCRKKKANGDDKAMNAVKGHKSVDEGKVMLVAMIDMDYT
jgi:hypothetical protein